MRAHDCGTSGSDSANDSDRFTIYSKKSIPYYNLQMMWLWDVCGLAVDRRWTVGGLDERFFYV
jgi:hypothetical protein